MPTHYHLHVVSTYVEFNSTMLNILQTVILSQTIVHHHNQIQECHVIEIIVPWWGHWFALSSQTSYGLALVMSYRIWVGGQDDNILKGISVAGCPLWKQDVTHGILGHNTCGKKYNKASFQTINNTKQKHYIIKEILLYIISIG